MAKDDKPQLTDDLVLGPGLVVTPGHQVQPKPNTDGPVFSDRRIDAHGVPADHAILSTVDGQSASKPSKPAPEPEAQPQV